MTRSTERRTAARYARRAGAFVVACALIAMSAGGALAQRGGRGGGIDPRLFGSSGEFYTPPDFHGNPAYDGRFTFARLKYRGYAMWAGREGPGWAHDYPDADEHLMRILREVTAVRPFVEAGNIVGGAIVALDDPALFRYPVGYLSEPGGWTPTDAEVKGMHDWLLKGGFVIFDDFNQFHWQNAQQQMAKVLPGLRPMQLTGNEPIFDSFFKIDVKLIERQCMANRRACYRGIPKYWAYFQDNDPKKRMLALGNVDADIGEFWQWSAQGFAPVDVSNEAYKLGVNWIVYALTH